MSATVLQSNSATQRGQVIEYGERQHCRAAAGRTTGIYSNYCACDGQASRCPGQRGPCLSGRSGVAITAPGKAVAGDGSEANPYIVSVDPGVIPLGSLLYLDGYGFGVAADTGGAIKGNRIDLLLASHEAALRFGRRKLRVYVLAR